MQYHLKIIRYFLKAWVIINVAPKRMSQVVVVDCVKVFSWWGRGKSLRIRIASSSFEIQLGALQIQ